MSGGDALQGFDETARLRRLDLGPAGEEQIAHA
jgi:hypothetical protein